MDMWRDSNRRVERSLKKKGRKTEEEEEESFLLCVLKEGGPLKYDKLSLEWWADAAP